MFRIFVNQQSNSKMNNYYQARIGEFLGTDPNTVFNTLAGCGSYDPGQAKAWREEIDMLREVLPDWKDEPAEVIFEYTIPRLAKRVDVVLFLRGIVFTLEFKAGEENYLQADMEQVMDYALDLKNFHKESHSRSIVPILISTSAQDSDLRLNPSAYDDMVYNPILVNNAENLKKTINNILEKETKTDPISFPEEEIDHWLISRYEPTPTIIEAANALYKNHTVADITRTEASGENLQQTTDYILKVIKKSKAKGWKTICFVTGVPGAGKTLVGLNVAIGQHASQQDKAVYLSGNGPLVKVLTAALAKDKKERDGGKFSDAEREVRGFIQEIYNYRETMLSKIKTPIVDEKLEIDETLSLADKDAGHAEIEHIAIFDEAQRSWTHKKLADWLARGGSYGNKRKVADFPMSEAEFLIWSLNLRKDWAVIICLVGGGQEIHTGEAGIKEWIEAVNTTFPDWHVFVSDHLTDREYAEGNVKKMLADNPKAIFNTNLHLGVSMRSFRAEKLSAFVHSLLERDVTKARALYAEIKDNYPIALTRDIEEAKAWLKEKARGSERYGIIVSSRAERLRPLAIDVKRKSDVVHWFLGDKTDLQSSYYLEDVATEFDVQGLELDWACVAWDGDLRYKDGEWDFYNFSRNAWQHNRQQINQDYQLNAYRVLLTRARQGMIICVPKGSDQDPTRLPEFYNDTFEFLKRVILI